VTPHPKPLSKGEGLRNRWFYTSVAKVLSFVQRTPYGGEGWVGALPFR